mmetsp:Transcript_32111/g.73446  ORF Transcript_32111/g.73446 Transcript_32111/m.73446 type:complete len:402 (+) Transcript_32111:102-1307(+)
MVASIWTCAWLPVVAAATSWTTTAGSSWQSHAPPWKAHTGSIAVALSDGTVVLAGGQAGEHGGALFDCFECMSEVWHFDPDSNKWSNHSAEVPWVPRWGHSMVATLDDTVWMLFGCCEPGKPGEMLRDVWTYNPLHSVPWQKSTAELPAEGIQGSSVTVVGSELWVVGGWSQHRGTLSLILALSTDSLKWKLLLKHGIAPWKHRADHATAISPDGRWLFLYAGQHRDAKSGHWWRLQDTWRIEISSVADPSAWLQLSDLNAARSSVPVLMLPSGWLLALGGHFIPDDEEIGSTLPTKEKPSTEAREAIIEHHRKSAWHVHNDVLALNTNNGGINGWQVLEADAPWPARDDAAAVYAKDGSLLIFGGGTLYGGGGYLRDVWKLASVASEYNLSEAAKGKTEL